MIIEEAVKFAYAAGLIDGDGCISIGKNYTKRQNRTSFQQIQIIVEQTRPEAVRWLKEEFGGYSYDRVSRTAKSKILYTWKLSDSKAVEFLEGIRFYLKNKADQAWLVLEYQASKTKYKGGSNHFMPEEERALREGFSLALSNAKRGAPS